jgi:RNA polymerase sporulation-specific sigma factor
MAKIISQNTDLNIIYYKQIMTGCYVNTFLSPLSLERETECLKKVAQNDKEAKDELILHNMRLVAHVTKKYAVSRLPADGGAHIHRHYRTYKSSVIIQG